MRRPLAWAAIATANLSAMTLYLWHQSAFLAVTWPGRHRPAARPADRARRAPLWIAERLAWLPVFAAALAVAWLLFHRAEHGRAPRWLSTVRRFATKWRIKGGRQPISPGAEEMPQAGRELAASR